MGLCFEMMNSKETAHELYTELYENLKNEDANKIEYLKNLMERTKP